MIHINLPKSQTVSNDTACGIFETKLRWWGEVAIDSGWRLQSTFVLGPRDMKDLKLYLNKLYADSEHCLTISKTTMNDRKREVFEMLAATYQRLAIDLEKIIATNALVDGERDKGLISLLRGEDGAERPDEIAKLLGEPGSEAK
jgi:hypothetical protein